MLAASPSGRGHWNVVLRPERDEWNYGIIVGSGSDAGPTSAAVRADEATEHAVSGTVASANSKRNPLDVISTGEG
jgi:hypothetical protein